MKKIIIRDFLRLCAVIIFVTIPLASRAESDSSIESTLGVDKTVSQFGASENHQNYFSSALNQEQCTTVISEILRIRADQTAPSVLLSIFENILFECGVSTEQVGISSQAVAFSFEMSKLFILWDGRHITLNEKAKATLEMTMPAQFNNFVTIKSFDPNLTEKKIGFVEKIKSAFSQFKNNLTVIYKEGETHLLLSGYAYHKRSSYPHYKKLNEFAVGLGWERSMINVNGNREAIAAMIFSDSHSDPEISISYEIAKVHKWGSGVKSWIGINAGLTARRDLMNYVPVPFVFPTVGLSIGKVSIRSIVIPRLGKGGGNVLFVFGSLQI